MPQEILIVLAIVGVLLWVIYKIIQGLGVLLTEMSDSLTAASNRRAKSRFTKKRSGLSSAVRVVIPDELHSARKRLEGHQQRFRDAQKKTWVPRRPVWNRIEFQPYIEKPQSDSYIMMGVDDLKSILAPNRTPWLEQETQILRESCSYPSESPKEIIEEFNEFPTFHLDLAKAIFDYDPQVISRRKIDKYFGSEQSRATAYNSERADLLATVETLNHQIKTWNVESRAKWETCTEENSRFFREDSAQYIKAAEKYRKSCHEQKAHFNAVREGYKLGKKESLTTRFNYVLSNIVLSTSVPRLWDMEFQEDQRILLVEIKLPDVVHLPPFKVVPQKNRPVAKPLNQSEKRDIVPKIHPAILIRFASEIFRNDDSEVLDLLALNGWIAFDDPRTGLNTKAYTASLLVQRNQVVNLSLEKLDPLAAFEALHGKSAGRLVEIVPIEPMLSLNRKDSRFVDPREVLNTLGNETNLASMDWQDFEHLVRELFEKEFSGRGAEVKITQASRDRGVDAIVFDPDPIHGGKYIIQAKRYTNTVDVSSVRDLCAVVKKEGASRGILVTTSSYGADAYAFANNEPVTLLNGAELLGLLKKHGYSFRINLEEARKVNQARA